MNKYRHGDVVCEQITSIPEQAKRIPTKPLALGEVTGHSHRIIVAEPNQLEMYELEGRLYFRLKTEGQLVHEEHKTITLEPGTYTTKIIREYDYITQEIESVRD